MCLEWVCHEQDRSFAAENGTARGDDRGAARRREPRVAGGPDLRYRARLPRSNPSEFVTTLPFREEGAAWNEYGRTTASWARDSPALRRRGGCGIAGRTRLEPNGGRRQRCLRGRHLARQTAGSHVRAVPRTRRRGLSAVR